VLDVINFWIDLIIKFINWLFTLNIYEDLTLGHAFIFFAILGMVIWFIFSSVIGGEKKK
jgi:hypothetical protein